MLTGQFDRRSGLARTFRAGITAAMLCGLALLAGGRPAQAQYVDPAAQRPFAIRVGTFFPSRKDIRRASGTAMPLVEVDATIQRFPEKSSISVVSLGYMERHDLRIVPLTVSQIYRDPNNVSGKNYYYGLGLGIYSTRLTIDDTNGKVKNLFGGFAVAGMDFTKSVFGEVKYHYISRYDDKFIGGLQLGVGTRF